MPPDTDPPAAPVLLNQIPAARLQAMWTKLPQQLSDLSGRPVRLTRFDESAGRMAMTLAMVGHALGEDELYLAVVGAFGDDDALQRCAALRTDQLRWPGHAVHDTQAMYLRQLLRVFRGERLDPAAVREIIKRCALAQASREDRRFVLPSIDGLDAIERGDERAWNLALARLVEAHAEEAMDGDLAFQPEGLVCMRALMLARLGLDDGMDCRIESPYLPVYLFDQD